MKEELWAIGQQRLAKIRPTTEGIRGWQAYLMDYQPIAEYPDDTYVWLACILALESVETGNFGVGCILVNDDGNVVVQGHNQVFNPHFRSDRHAEMVVMDNFEDANPQLTNLEGYTLYTSLEPCPMCLVRLSTCNISNVLFAATDVEGGMVHRLHNLPPFWLELAQRKTFGRARCAQDLVNVATQIFFLNLDALIAKIKAR
ncbi:MAG: nucleoside deaminase [candidate division NC10 bacterium]|nr:nucleoside deaminase [candidate division NC10 bacterium]